MTGSATPTDKQQELDQRTWRAWKAYFEATQSLTGEAYERVERESWSVLQNELRRLEGSRPELMAPRF